jgi:tetratricopeptide (TPR) repeat protein
MVVRGSVALNQVKAKSRHAKAWWGYLAFALALFWIALAYLPVLHAGFVWDDVVDFRNMAWLREGDSWRQFLFQNFNDWKNYFRPLVVALFTFEVRSFLGAPGPMHGVSLLIHLANAGLVGCLSFSVARNRLSGLERTLWPALATLVYGLHPLLIEPVTWIGCQFDLCVTLFTLLALLIQTTTWPVAVRAVTVSACFFLAACAKESALSFPLLVVLFDFFAVDRHPGNARQTVLTLVKREWPVYVGMLLAGVAYMMLRHWALGSLIPQAGTSSSLGTRLQEISYLYVQYWRMLVLPTLGMSPIHLWPDDHFASLTPMSLATGVMALAIVAIGVYLSLRRSVWGALVMVVTAALLPALHIISASFDQSPYHERYAMMALSVACALLPALLLTIRMSVARQRQMTWLAGALFLGWSLASTATIRSVVPLWSNNISLWRWALIVNPNSHEAIDGLISAYVDNSSYTAAVRAFDAMGPHRMDCTNCALNIAIAHIKLGRLDAAKNLLDSIKDADELQRDTMMRRAYLNNRAKLDTLQGNLAEAEIGFRQAMAMDSLDPQPAQGLSTLLLLQGKDDQAQAMETRVLQLLPPEERPAQKSAFDHLAESLHARAEGNVPSAEPIR